MKILYLHQYFNTPEMSGGTRSYEMAKRFVEAGHEVEMITSQRDAENKSQKGWVETEEEGIRVHWYPIPYSNKMGYRKRVKAFLQFACLSGRRATQLGGDVVFATSTPLTIALPGAYTSKRLRIPLIFEVRDLWPEIPIAMDVLTNPFLVKLTKWLERLAYYNSSRVVALSPGMKDGVERAGFPPEKISVIPNSCDVDLFDVPERAGQDFLTQHPELKGGPLVTYAGTIGKINKVEYLPEIASEMKEIDPSVNFLIVGSGKFRQHVVTRAKKLGVYEDNLWMIKRVSKSEMPKIMSVTKVATSLFVDLPEMWNNSANKFFDALAASTPIMINYKGWQAEILEETGAGFVVPPDDSEQAARMLNSFLEDEDRLQKAEEAAFRLAKTEFDRDDLARQLREVLEKAHNERNG